MRVRAVRGGNGIFSGWGVTRVPYLSTQIPVKFERVWIDEDFNLVKGEVVALSEGLEGFQQRWQQEHPAQPEHQQDPSEANEAAATAADNPTGSQDEAAVTTLTIESEVVQVYVNDAGQVVAVDSENKEEIVAQQVPKEGEVLAITDQNGNSYSVDAEGNISKENNLSGSATNASASHQDKPDGSDLEQKLVAEVLEAFEKQLEGWLNTYVLLKLKIRKM